MHATLAPTPAASNSHSGGTRLYALYVVSLGVCLIGNLVVRLGERGGWLPVWAQVTLAVVAAAPLFLAAAFFWRLLRRELDEMLQRVVLEGLAIAAIVYVPLAALYVNLRTAGVFVARLDPPDILLTPALLAALGIAIASRRYQ